MRRKPGQLVPFEESVLAVLGDRELHGVAIAHELGMDRKSGYARLYKALRRLETDPGIGGRLVSRWEESERQNVPRRRLYRRPPPSQRGPKHREG